MLVKMMDMALTPKESKDEAPQTAAADAPKGPLYPYGLCVRLDKESLGKLGLSGDLPEVGEMISFQATAKVTSASMNENLGSDGTKSTSECIELQITQMGVEGDPAEAAEAEGERRSARRNRMYGDKKSGEKSDAA